jgi:hypothetical protein
MTGRATVSCTVGAVQSLLGLECWLCLPWWLSGVVHSGGVGPIQIDGACGGDVGLDPGGCRSVTAVFRESASRCHHCRSDLVQPSQVGTSPLTCERRQPRPAGRGTSEAPRRGPAIGSPSDSAGLGQTTRRGPPGTTPHGTSPDLGPFALIALRTIQTRCAELTAHFSKTRARRAPNASVMRGSEVRARVREDDSRVDQSTHGRGRRVPSQPDPEDGWLVRVAEGARRGRRRRSGGVARRLPATAGRRGDQGTSSQAW